MSKQNKAQKRKAKLKAKKQQAIHNQQSLTERLSVTLEKLCEPVLPEYGGLGNDAFPNFRQQVMREAAMGFPSLSIQEETVTGAHSVVENIIRLRKNGVTALIVPSEGYEFRVRQAIQLLGIKLPEEMALITWENPGESEQYDPPQTTVEQNIPLIVKTALDNLEALIAGKEIHNVEIDYILHDRKSW